MQSRIATNRHLLYQEILKALKRRTDPAARPIDFGHEGKLNARWFEASIDISPLEFQQWFCQEAHPTLLSAMSAGVVKIRLERAQLETIVAKPLSFLKQDLAGTLFRSVKNLVYAKYSVQRRKLTVYFLIRTLMNGNDVERIATVELFRRRRIRR